MFLVLCITSGRRNKWQYTIAENGQVREWTCDELDEIKRIHLQYYSQYKLVYLPGITI